MVASSLAEESSSRRKILEGYITNAFDKLKFEPRPFQVQIVLAMYV